MSATVTLSEAVERLLKASQLLSVDERLALAQAIWDTVSQAANWKPAPEDIHEVHHRREELRQHPGSGISEGEMNQRLTAMRVS